MIRWWGRTAGVPHSFPGSIRALACGGWRPRRPLFRRIAGGTPNTASIRGNDIPVVGGWRAMDRNVHAPRRLVRPQFSVKLTASRGMPWGENQVKKSDAPAVRPYQFWTAHQRENPVGAHRRGARLLARQRRLARAGRMSRTAAASHPYRFWTTHQRDQATREALRGRPSRSSLPPQASRWLFRLRLHF